MKFPVVVFAFLFASGVAFAEEGKAGADWWSLQKLERPAPPEVKAAAWVRNPIDAFVLAKLEAAGLEPSPEADAQALNRRLHFDLIGLPPKGEKSVDELLASPHYGERWARHWLDVARYGESQGFEYDQLRPNAWPYRDWVINALNEDMPYDRFAALQIAGDVIEPGNADAITATGFLVCGAFDGLKPNGDKQRKIMRQDELDDLVGTVAQSFLGLTVHCARCHDHKFDPILQKEYYQMSSALAGVTRADRDVPAGGNADELRQQIGALSTKLTEAEEVIRKRILARQGRASEGPEPPQPIALWTFDKDFRDQIGGLHGEAKNGARIEGGALVLDGADDFVITGRHSRELTAKTLEAWVKIDQPGTRGGGVISVQNVDGGQFDAIVWAEKEAGRWMAGSDAYRRTQNFGGEEEGDAASGFVHVAITYAADGTITGYRNGLPYGKAYKTGTSKYLSNNNQILFGLRHGNGPGKGRMLAGRIDRAQLFDRALRPEEIARSADVRFVTEAELVAALTPEQRAKREQWKADIGRLNGELSRVGKKKVYAVRPSGNPVIHLLLRGSPFELGEEVSAGGVAAVASSLSSEFGLAPNANAKERRKKLAEWISHADNPLFARVMVNRLWHYHFGQGLVKTPNDLGYSGGVPSHPELLDWLAAEFRESGWSLKKMHKLIVDSATYRQASRASADGMAMDAGNDLLWRHAPWRLEAEVVRDSVLSVAGQLNPKMGGAGYRDFKMYKHKGSWVYDPIDPEGEEFNRRSIYRTWARGNIHPLLSPLDCPDPSATAPVRSVTTTPLGALAMMNTSFVLRMSDKFAERLKAEAGDDVSKQVAAGFRLAYGRPATAEEIKLTTKFAQDHGLPALCRVLFNANEFLYVN